MYWPNHFSDSFPTLQFLNRIQFMLSASNSYTTLTTSHSYSQYFLFHVAVSGHTSGAPPGLPQPAMTNISCTVHLGSNNKNETPHPTDQPDVFWQQRFSFTCAFKRGPHPCSHRDNPTETTHFPSITYTNHITTTLFYWPDPPWSKLLGTLYSFLFHTLFLFAVTNTVSKLLSLVLQLFTIPHTISQFP